MTPAATPKRYTHHRFPADIMSHGVWLYDRFCLSYRDVEELLFARRIIVTWEAVRKRCWRFGQAYVNHLRRQHPRPADKWHEVDGNTSPTLGVLARARIPSSSLVLDKPPSQVDIVVGVTYAPIGTPARGVESR